MKVGNYDEPSAKAKRSFNFLQVDAKVIFKTARKALYLGAQELRGADQHFIGGMLDQDFIAGIERGRQGEKITKRSSVRGHHAIPADSTFLCDCLLQRFVTVVARS